jgi:hypothetical protein
MAPAFNFYKGDLTLAIKNKTTSNCVENLYIFKFYAALRSKNFSD